MRVVTFGSLGEPVSLELGSPAPLARLYAEHPLATAFGFFAVGWAGGYLSWRYLIAPPRKRRRR